ncbi:hypothetical protein DMENIID0001_114070 [Sergentomyia squamirostris]
MTHSKMLECNLTGPQIRDLVKDKEFSEMNIVFIFPMQLENKIFDELLDSYKEMNVNHSLKIHVLRYHLDCFPSNCGDFSDEHGERFHQMLRNYEERFQGKATIDMLAEYFWSISK